MNEDIKQALIELLKSPKQYSVDGESITAQSASDALALLKKLEAEEAGGKNPLKRLGLFRVRPERAMR